MATFAGLTLDGTDIGDRGYDYNLYVGTGLSVFGTLSSARLVGTSLDVAGTLTAGSLTTGTLTELGAVVRSYNLFAWWALAADTTLANLDNTLSNSLYPLKAASVLPAGVTGATLMDANGIVTVPVSGIYSFDFYVRFSTLDGPRSLWFYPIFGLGVTARDSNNRLSTIVVDDTAAMSVSFVAPLRAGDQVQPIIWSGTSAASVATVVSEGAGLRLTLLCEAAL